METNEVKMKTFNQIRQELAEVNEAKHYYQGNTSAYHQHTSHHPQIKRDQKDAHGGSFIHNHDGHEVHTAEHEEGTNFHHHDKNTGKHHVITFDHNEHEPDDFHKVAKKQHPRAPKHVINAIHQYTKDELS